MLIILRTFYSFPYSAKAQLCRSWEVAESGSEPKLANGNIQYHGCHAQFMNGGLAMGQEISLFFEFGVFHEFGLFPIVW